MDNGLWIMVVLFVIGGGFMIFELIIPGFGIAGILSVAALIGGTLVGASFLSGWQLAIVIFIVVAICFIALVIMYRSAVKNGRISRLLFLNAKAQKKEGYSSSKNYEGMMGKEGLAITNLRPSGMGEFDGVKLDIVTHGEFIPRGERIKIASVEGFRITVEKIGE